MSLTPKELPTFKAAILAQTDSTFVALRQANDEQGMAAWYNGSDTFQVWRSTTDAPSVFNAISWANLTPADTPDATATYTNRALLCQARQINLQILLQGQSSIATSKLSIRQGLQDGLLNVPAGIGGAPLDAGWAGAGKVKATIQRACTKAERLWATGTGTTANPGDLGSFEGLITAQDVSDALRS